MFKLKSKTLYYIDMLEVNVAGASSSLLDLYIQMCGTCPTVGVSYLMTVCSNKWDMVVSDLCHVLAQPDSHSGLPHLIPIRSILSDRRLNLLRPIPCRSDLHYSGIGLDRNLQHFSAGCWTCALSACPSEWVNALSKCFGTFIAPIFFSRP